MVRGNIRKHDVVPSKKIRKPKHRRKLPEEISFDASEQEEIEEIGFKISRSKKKRYRHKHSKSNKKESKKSKRKSRSRSRSRSKTGSDPKGKTSTKSSKSSIPSKTTLSEVEKLEGSNKEISRPKLFQVIDSLRSLDAMQPTQNQIIDLVDSQFRELDLQRSTVSDVYKIVEDHFMTVMSKKNRKVIRHRLIELSSEKTLDQEEKTENAPRLESSLFADDIVSKQDEEILFFIEEQSEDDVGLDQNEKIVSSPNEASNGFRDGRLFAIKKTDKDRHANSGGGRNKSSSRMRHYHPDPHDDYDEVDHESLQYETNLRKKSSKYRRRRTLGMDQSVLSFKNLSLVNGRGRNKKYILKNISGKVKAGGTCGE